MNKSDKELFASYNAVYGTKISDNTGCTVENDNDELSEFDGQRIMKENYSLVNFNEFP